MMITIHFEDTLFYINERLRLLEDSLVLDLHPDLFMDTLWHDLECIQNILETLTQILTENDKFVNWEHRLKDTQETEQWFGEIINMLIQGKGTIGAALIPISEKLSSYKEASRLRMQRLDNLEQKTPVEKDHSIVVSSQELQELLGGL
ncbi:MAG: hypothetical protein SNJ56_06785 [Termitinemataceae bacterium]